MLMALLLVLMITEHGAVTVARKRVQAHKLDLVVGTSAPLLPCTDPLDGNERLHPLTLPSLPQLSTLPNVIASFSPELNALPCD